MYDSTLLDGCTGYVLHIFYMAFNKKFILVAIQYNVLSLAICNLSYIAQVIRRLPFSFLELDDAGEKIWPPT